MKSQKLLTWKCMDHKFKILQNSYSISRVLARHFKTCVRDSLLGIIWRPRMKNMRNVSEYDESSWQCSAEKFHNWGQCPRAFEKVGTFEKKVGTVKKKVGTL